MRWLREPIWIFLLIGLALFWLDARQADQRFEIDVTAPDLDRISAQWQAQSGRPPTSTELSGLIDQFVEEEVYYREALRLELDRDDTIIRRRMVQKLTFLTEDLATSTAPDEAQLRVYLHEHAASYRVPQKYSFRHIYYSRDRREDAQADALAALSITTNRESQDDPVGDPFMLQTSFAERTERNLAGTFGSKFASLLSDLPINTWSGPVESAYGWHLVYIHAIQPAYLPEFGEVATRLANDYQADVRKRANATHKKALVAKYRINRP
jgi:hypothetical protein